MQTQIGKSGSLVSLLKKDEDRKDLNLKARATHCPPCRLEPKLIGNRCNHNMSAPVCRLRLEMLGLDWSKNTGTITNIWLTPCQRL